MMRRCYFLGLLALWAGASGCAGTARRPDGSSIFAPRAAIEAPAPPQRQVAIPPERADVVAQPTASPVGLSKYFPGLRRNQADSTQVAATPRHSWFGLRSKGSTQIYTTDARASLNRVGPEPMALPVALQVPTDPAVTPTSAETVLPDSPTGPMAASPGPSKPDGADPLSGPPSQVPDFGGAPSKPGEDEVNPLPPAAEPGTPADVVNRMPALPAIDPRERPQLANPQPAQSNPVPNPEPDFGQTGDNQAVKAITRPTDPTSATDLPEATLPASYSTHHHSAKAQKTVVYASAQVAPSPQAKPSPQGLASPQSCEETSCQYHKWKKPCFCRLVRKILKQGEFANPPTTVVR